MCYVGSEEVPWYVQTTDTVGRPLQVEALRRHDLNDRSNSVAREAYAQIIVKEGVLAELRVPWPSGPGLQVCPRVVVPMGAIGLAPLTGSGQSACPDC